MSNSIFNEKVLIHSNKLIAYNTYEAFMESSQISKFVLPGQFINISPNDSWTNVMRRPMSIASKKDNLISIIYKVVGDGTKIMSNWKKGDSVDIIGPLGNYWDHFNDKINIIIGGGVGIAPILFLHNFLNKKSINHYMFMGARSEKEHFLNHSITDKIILTTDDGSLGIKGNVIDGLDNILNDLVTNSDKYKIFVCGPPMMMESVKSLCDKNNILCDIALETIMACGFGICQGCTVEFNNQKIENHSYRSKYGLVCCDGPIFNSKDIKTCLL